MLRRAAVILMVLLTPGCATVFRGTRQDVAVRSDPPAASVHAANCGTVDREWTTPAVISVSRKSTDCTVRVSKWGYQDQTVRISRNWEPVGDIVMPEDEDLKFSEKAVIFVIQALFLIGNTAVDASTGASYTLDPPAIDVWLREADLAPEVLEPGYPWIDEIPPSRGR